MITVLVSPGQSEVLLSRAGVASSLVPFALWGGALTVALPDLWADPLGPLLETPPLVVATLVMIAIEVER